MFILQVLKCISQLELAQLIGTSVKTKYIPSHKREKSNGGTAYHIEAFDPEGKLHYTFLFVIVISFIV
jgi:hypothetical protein